MMQTKTKDYIDSLDLQDYSIRAQDGEVGRITDLYFDEKLFYLRYLIVDTAPFLFRNLVLVSPISFKKIDPNAKVIEVRMTVKDLEESPPIDDVETVSDQYEKSYNENFSWTSYWGYEGWAWSIGPYGIPWGHYDQLAQNKDWNKKVTVDDKNKSRLRSAKEIQSYSVEGVLENFGHIQSFIFNSKTLAIDYFVIDTINYFPSKNVLLRPEWIEKINWHLKSIRFPFLKELIKSAPAYKKGKLTEEFLEDTQEHFSPAIKEVNSIKQIEKSKSFFHIKNQRDLLNEHNIH